MDDEEEKRNGQGLEKSILLGEEGKKEYPKIKYNQKCPKHNLIVHSFVKTSRDLLCTKCIYEKNLSPA